MRVYEYNVLLLVWQFKAPKVFHVNLQLGLILAYLLNVLRAVPGAMVKFNVFLIALSVSYVFCSEKLIQLAPCILRYLKSCVFQEYYPSPPGAASLAGKLEEFVFHALD